MIELGRDHGVLVEVTFRLPSECGADRACVVGDFNDWSTTTHPMQRDENGLTVSLALVPGRAYRFRYLLDGERWENDWAAHAYVPNEFGGDDSLIDLTTIPAQMDGTSGSIADEEGDQRR